MSERTITSVYNDTDNPVNVSDLLASRASLVAALRDIAFEYESGDEDGLRAAIVAGQLAATAGEPSEPEGTTLSLAHIDKAAEAMGVTRKQLDDLISPTTPTSGTESMDNMIEKWLRRFGNGIVIAALAMTAGYMFYGMYAGAWMVREGLK